MNIIDREARFASVAFLLGSGYLWLARDLNGSIAAYSHKPFKLDDEVWRVEEGESKEMWADDGDLYNFVKWEDDEPVNIREWLKNEEVEWSRGNKIAPTYPGDAISDKDTTLGGLLTSDFYTGVEKIPSHPKAFIQVDASNWGKSRTAAIEAAKDYMDKGIGHPGVTYTPVTPKFDPDNVHAHLEVCGELNVIYERKNADYGDSFAQSLDKHGLIAAIVRLDDKMNRVINLNKADEQLVNDESVRDTLIDLANYAIMSVMWLDKQKAIKDLNDCAKDMDNRMSRTI